MPDISIPVTKLAAYRAAAYLYVNKNATIPESQLFARAIRAAALDIHRDYRIAITHTDMVDVRKLVRELMDAAK